MSSSLAPARPIAARRPLWRAHGKSVYHCAGGDPAAVSSCAIDVYSYYAPGVSKAPFVLLAAKPTPVRDFWHLTPTKARELAAQLIEAAESAEAEQASHDVDDMRGR